VTPCPRPQFPEDLGLRLCPERPRNAQHPSPLPRELHCFDPPVVVGHAFDETITLQKVEAAGKRRLVDGQRSLEFSQVRLAAVRDGCENAELSHPEPARPQDVVVELRDGTADHAQRAADARGQSRGSTSVRRSYRSSPHRVILPSDLTPAAALCMCTHGQDVHTLTTRNIRGGGGWVAVDRAVRGPSPMFVLHAARTRGHLDCELLRASGRRRATTGILRLPGLTGRCMRGCLLKSSSARRCSRSTTAARSWSPTFSGRSPPTPSRACFARTRAS